MIPDRPAALKPIAGQKTLNLSLRVQHGDPVLTAGHGQIPPLRDVGAFFKHQLARGVLLAGLLLQKQGQRLSASQLLQVGGAHVRRIKLGVLVSFKPLAPVLSLQAATKPVATWN